MPDVRDGVRPWPWQPAPFFLFFLSPVDRSNHKPFVKPVHGNSDQRLHVVYARFDDVTSSLGIASLDMAVSIEQWFCSELSKLGIEATEDNAKYILSMTDAEDLKDYMLSLLDGSDPAVQKFIPQLITRWQAFGAGHNNELTNLKSKQGETKKKYKYKQEKNSSASLNSTNEKASTVRAENGINPLLDQLDPLLCVESVPYEGVEMQQSARKKNKFVPLYSLEGREKLVIKLPGRTLCECQAAKHKLINNCINCGRVVCEQEGAGPCLFCGKLVCTPSDQEVLARGSKKSEKLRQHLMRDAEKFVPLIQQSGQQVTLLTTTAVHTQEGLEKALKHKDKLIEYDRASVRRTRVIDDECDYFTTNSQWLSRQDRDTLQKREDELHSQRHKSKSRQDRVVTLDFAGRQVIEEANLTGQMMYSHNEALQQEHLLPDKDQQKTQEKDRACIVNPIVLQPPKFLSQTRQILTKTGNNKSSDIASTKDCNRPPVIQDRELNEMSDEGMCLSMHQPWASLLVAGIKMHEGRSWYTAHRGRLWIASTAKFPSSQEITDMENHYQNLYNQEEEFPKDYPVGCLLGCVDVVDCLSQEEYRKKFPEGESTSPYVFICENPQELVIKFPMKGKHKIYKLESSVLQAAKKGLR
ncbi:activating signal cointegrator 1-like isoform X2 [Pomacea canaliculata]|uniref:activating signal cointegrator 1-like isoform X2 n=1 Tax=Pomacea canaliculata TaxID=400727 RepID=UPI000D73178F|nr:activating signal cointegrator 1-like isoform X2 [Pomacea canaliculata]